MNWTLKKSSQRRYAMKFLWILRICNDYKVLQTWPQLVVTVWRDIDFFSLDLLNQWRCFYIWGLILSDGFTALPADGALSTSPRRSFAPDCTMTIYCCIAAWRNESEAQRGVVLLLLIFCFVFLFCRCQFGYFTATVWVNPLLAGLFCLVHLRIILTWSFAEHCSTVNTFMSSAITPILLLIIFCIIHYLLLLFVEAQHNILDFFSFWFIVEWNSTLCFMELNDSLLLLEINAFVNDVLSLCRSHRRHDVWSHNHRFHTTNWKWWILYIKQQFIHEQYKTSR